MYSSKFTEASAPMKASRLIYMKVVAAGTLAVTVAMFRFFSIYWGALWKISAHNLQGWVLDFDRSTVGNAVVQGLLSSSSKVSWMERPSSDFSGGAAEVANLVVNQKTWIAVVVNSNATTALQSAVSTANSSYDGSEAITVYAIEARNENAYRAFIHPSVQTSLAAITQNFSQSFLQKVASSSSDTLVSISTTAPQVLTEPISYTLNNLRPFDVPVASAVTFVGLIYVLVLHCEFLLRRLSTVRTRDIINDSLPCQSQINIQFHCLLCIITILLPA